MMGVDRSSAAEFNFPTYGGIGGVCVCMLDVPACVGANVRMTFLPLQIVFEGIRGTSFTGDIAIDDISMSATCCIGMPV